jgi:rubrerythrin
MEGKPFIAEMHDIGKLIDKEALDREGISIPRHTLSKIEFSHLGILQPSSPSWYAQFSEGVNSLSKTGIPRDYLADIVLTGIADEVASSVSRTWIESKDFVKKKGRSEFVQEGIHLLWRPNFYKKEKDSGKTWAAVTTSAELKEMLKFMDNCESHEEFFERFKESLALTPEDKSVPVNIVTLFTHLELMGKIYRILKRHSCLTEENGKLYLTYDNQRIQNANEAAGQRISEHPDQGGKWIYRLVYCKVSFYQSFSRLQDLNVLKYRSNLIKSLSEDGNKKDYVLFFTDDSLCLFLPIEDEMRIEELLEPLLDAGFIVDYKEMEAELILLKSAMEKAYRDFHRRSVSKKRHLKLYQKRLVLDSDPEIQPPICDSCQIRSGTERLKEMVREYLCDTCYKIREMGEPAHEYAEWQGKAVWMKITLDQDQLENTIYRLFESYVDNSEVLEGVDENDKNELKESFRPLAVQMDFVKEYKKLLQAFKERILSTRDSEGNPFFTEKSFLFPIEGNNEFGIFKVSSERAITNTLDTFTSLLREFFPECLEDSPIKLSLGIANVKYPYQEHWQFLSSPGNSINIKSPTAHLAVSISQYEKLEEKIGRGNIRVSHFLHRLTETSVEFGSDITLLVEIFNKRKRFPEILEVLKDGLTPADILNFYELAYGEVS